MWRADMRHADACPKRCQDTSFARLTKIQMELGLFDNNKAKQPYFNLGIDTIDAAEHQQLALEAAQQAVVLLKNEKSTLPLKQGPLNS